MDCCIVTNLPGRSCSGLLSLGPRDLLAAIALAISRPVRRSAAMEATCPKYPAVALARPDGDPQAVFAMIEEDLRARMAVPIETKLALAR